MSKQLDGYDINRSALALVGLDHNFDKCGWFYSPSCDHLVIVEKNHEKRSKRQIH